MRKRLTTQRMAALVSALLLTLVMAVPAAANEKVHIQEFSEEWEAPEEMIPDCTGPVYYGGYGKGDLWLWYRNGLTADEQMPDGVAWPWIRGKGVAQGLDYFSSGPGMTGKVITGKWKVTDHMNRHHLGTPGDPNDLESWRVTTTGKGWGIQAPGYGTVFHVAGKDRGTITVVEQVPGPYDPITYEPDDPERWHQGKVEFDVESLCAYFGFEVAAP
mgnify:FL=1